MKRGLLTVGYCRVSTSGQAEEGYSLEAQRKKIEAYCNLHELQLLEVIQDAGFSGKSMNSRPGIKRVIELIKNRQVNNVVIFKLDRMARNLKEACEIAELMEKKKVALHSVSEKIDTSSATGKLFYNILAAMAAWEREIISERTRTALAVKRENGQRISGHAPFGFKFNEDGNLVINDYEQKMISRACELYSLGKSVRVIARLLAIEGYQNRNNKPLGRNEVWAIVKKNASKVV